ncbi:MAG: universal stress protein [Solirubrobacteraceae bacterium]|nr:universal stress protein [Solirubrobacteraceae bacterium]
MFKKVIVGIDGYRSDKDAVAAARAVAPSAKLNLVMVYAASEEPTTDNLDSYRELLRGDAIRKLEERQRESGVPEATITAIPSFAPSKGIKEYARAQGADLIVLGAASRGPLGRAVVGDVARGVLNGAPCPVLSVARSHAAAATTPRVIGVAYDSSPEADAALALAVAVAQESGGTIELVEAVDVGVTPQVWGFQVAEYLEGLVGPEHERLHTLAQTLPVPAKASAVRGSVHKVIHDLSTRVDLLVCGSRSWGAPGRIAFGSTADRLVHHSPCPVMIVPRSATAEHADPALAEATAVA